MSVFDSFRRTGASGGQPPSVTSSSVILAGVVLLMCAVGAHGAPFIFDTAATPPANPSGTIVGDFNWPLHRLEVEPGPAVRVGTVGGFFQNHTDVRQEVFAAIIELSGPSDLPDSISLTTPDVLGTTLITVSPTELPGQPFAGTLDLTLAPGHYALQFGTGAFGAATTGAVGLSLPDHTVDLDPLQRTVVAIQPRHPTLEAGFVLSGVNARFFATEYEPSPSSEFRLWTVGQQGNISRSDDGGRSWTALDGGTTSWLRAVDFVDANFGSALGDDGTVLHTTNGGSSWQSQTNVAAHTLDARAVDFVNREVGWAIGSVELVLKTTDGGNTWSRQQFDIPGSSNSMVDVQFLNEREGWVAAFGGGLHKTTDGGSTWLESSPPFLKHDISFVDFDHGWAAGGTEGLVWKTVDGETWKSIEVAGANDNGIMREVVFVDRNTGWASNAHKIWHTRDAGESWVELAPLLSGTIVRDLDFADATHGWLLATSGQRAYTIDGGNIWTFVDNIDPQFSAEAFAFVRVIPGLNEPLSGDYDNNGIVEQRDLDIVLLFWGEQVADVPLVFTGDMPNDAIDQEELDSVLLNWGETAQQVARATSGAIPEPSSLGLLACLFVAIKLRGSNQALKRAGQPHFRKIGTDA